MVAFLMVGALPMLASAYLAATIVSSSFESAIQKWLAETSLYFLRDFSESQSEAALLGDFILAKNRWFDSPSTIGQRQFIQLLKQMHYEIITLYDQNDHIVFSSLPVDRIQSIPLSDAGWLFRVDAGGESKLAIGGVTQGHVNGQKYRLVIASWFNKDYLTHLDDVASLELSFYYNSNGEYLRFVSSLPGATATETQLPQAIVDRLGQGEAAVYDPESEDGKFRGLYTPLRDSERRLVGVLFCGLKVTATVGMAIRRQNLFFLIFTVGVLLSLGSALALSRRLTTPLRRLSKAVRAVTGGDYGQKVIVTGNDEVAQLSTAFNDMTGQLEGLRRREAELRRSERFSALGEMAAGMAHEIRNPLGIIKTSAQLVRKDPDSAQNEALLGYVVEQVTRIDNSIRNFLAVAKPSPPHLSQHQPVAILERLARFIAPEMESRGITLEMGRQNTSVPVMCDENQIFQACLNLVLNASEAIGASEAMEPPGEAIRPGGYITLACEVIGREVVMRFTDNGPGVPGELSEMIFNPFFTTKAEGSGLGLAKVVAIMEAHQGWVEYVSPPEGGAEFRLILPRMDEDTHEPQNSDRR
ncbi:MAG: HAMP domain-containing protein [Alphaproteobacteria bacterium]|nr:HAMP domain-containing protein [Alphaproteobacteria bacterium]